MYHDHDSACETHTGLEASKGAPHMGVNANRQVCGRSRHRQGLRVSDKGSTNGVCWVSLRRVQAGSQGKTESQTAARKTMSSCLTPQMPLFNPGHTCVQHPSAGLKRY